ncbi:hypothetical protein J0S82_009429 [Galemys pyrenaicus]|uniref:Uncharacterized protein n=1 Tax=Galemys pyrenaicus TaxID=202257 RepID=A0A8J6E028_GALPY|nr:hypothetical protein J0S82_009429 [Galemys pyrenaicus]
MDLNPVCGCLHANTKLWTETPSGRPTAVELERPQGGPRPRPCQGPRGDHSPGFASGGGAHGRHLSDRGPPGPRPEALMPQVPQTPEVRALSPLRSAAPCRGPPPPWGAGSEQVRGEEKFRLRGVGVLEHRWAAVESAGGAAGRPRRVPAVRRRLGREQDLWLRDGTLPGRVRKRRVQDRKMPQQQLVLPEAVERQRVTPRESPRSRPPAAPTGRARKRRTRTPPNYSQSVSGQWGGFLGGCPEAAQRINPHARGVPCGDRPERVMLAAKAARPPEPWPLDKLPPASECSTTRLHARPPSRPKRHLGRGLEKMIWAFPHADVKPDFKVVNCRRSEGLCQEHCNYLETQVRPRGSECISPWALTERVTPRELVTPAVHAPATDTGSRRLPGVVPGLSKRALPRLERLLELLAHLRPCGLLVCCAAARSSFDLQEPRCDQSSDRPRPSSPRCRLRPRESGQNNARTGDFHPGASRVSELQLSPTEMPSELHKIPMGGVRGWYGAWGQGQGQGQGQGLRQEQGRASRLAAGSYLSRPGRGFAARCVAEDSWRRHREVSAACGHIWRLHRQALQVSHCPLAGWPPPEGRGREPVLSSGLGGRGPGFTRVLSHLPSTRLPAGPRLWLRQGYFRQREKVSPCCPHLAQRNGDALTEGPTLIQGPGPRVPAALHATYPSARRPAGPEPCSFCSRAPPPLLVPMSSDQEPIPTPPKRPAPSPPCPRASPHTCSQAPEDLCDTGAPLALRGCAAGDQDTMCLLQRRTCRLFFCHSRKRKSEVCEPGNRRCLPPGRRRPQHGRT